MIKQLLIIFIAISSISCGVKQSKRSENLKGTLPQMTLINAEGNPVELTSFKGKKVFVNLWATWCPPCVAEMPSIQALYEKAGSENAAFVLISFDKSFETAKKWVKQKNITVPVFGANAADLPQLFQVEGIPTTFIFNENGDLIFSYVGQENYSKDKFVTLLSKN
jgi:thiol-disulfide isomerase/thioredoxin